MLPEELLDTAGYLLRRNQNRPTQADLRRAISTAYYALFHFLIREACARLTTRPELRTQSARAFNHRDMKMTCQAVQKSQPPAYLGLVLGSPVTDDLKLIAEAFVLLQTTRHDADYNFDFLPTRTGAGELVQQVRDAVAAWDRVKRDPAADAFLLGLLLGERWNR